MNNQTEVNDSSRAEGQSLLNVGLGAWVSIGDRLPEPGNIYLCAVHEYNSKQNKLVTTVSFYKGDEEWTTDDSMDIYAYEPLFWMPLPEAPNA